MGVIGARWDMQNQVFRALLDSLDIKPTAFSVESWKRHAEIGGGIDTGNCTRAYGNDRDPRNFGVVVTPRVAKLLAILFKEKKGLDWISANWLLSLLNAAASHDGWELFLSDDDNAAILEELTGRSAESFRYANERLSA